MHTVLWKLTLVIKVFRKLARRNSMGSVQKWATGLVKGYSRCKVSGACFYDGVTVFSVLLSSSKIGKIWRPLFSLCAFFFNNTHLLVNLTVKEVEIQATKMENLGNSKEAGAGVKSAMFLRNFLALFRGKGERFTFSSQSIAGDVADVSW